MRSCVCECDGGITVNFIYHFCVFRIADTGGPYYLVHAIGFINHFCRILGCLHIGQRVNKHVEFACIFDGGWNLRLSAHDIVRLFSVADKSGDGPGMREEDGDHQHGYFTMGAE